MVLRTANKESAIKDSASSVTDYVKIAADHRYLNEKDETCEICGEKTRDVIDEAGQFPCIECITPIQVSISTQAAQRKETSLLRQAGNTGVSAGTAVLNKTN